MVKFDFQYADGSGQVVLGAETDAGLFGGGRNAFGPFLWVRLQWPYDANIPRHRARGARRAAVGRRPATRRTAWRFRCTRSGHRRIVRAAHPGRAVSEGRRGPRRARHHVLAPPRLAPRSLLATMSTRGAAPSGQISTDAAEERMPLAPECMRVPRSYGRRTRAGKEARRVAVASAGKMRLSTGLPDSSRRIVHGRVPVAAASS